MSIWEEENLYKDVDDSLTKVDFNDIKRLVVEWLYEANNISMSEILEKQYEAYILKNHELVGRWSREI